MRDVEISHERLIKNTKSKESDGIKLERREAALASFFFLSFSKRKASK